MSPTRKARPTDKASAAEHKPSHKVAMNEVLRTLQDLVQNELVVEPAAPVAAEPKPRSWAPKPDQAPASSMPTLELLSEESLPDLTELPSPAAAPAPAIPPGGLQTELPYLESPLETPASESAPAATDLPPGPDSLFIEPLSPLPEMPSLSPDAEAVPFAPVAEAPDAVTIDAPPLPMTEATAPPPALAPEQTSDGGNLPELGDFPVLEDAVELSHETEPSATALPSATDARRLAIQVAARLNVELRREGRDGLSSELITRLAHLLEEALAKAGANMENTGPEQH